MQNSWNRSAPEQRANPWRLWGKILLSLSLALALLVAWGVWHLHRGRTTAWPAFRQVMNRLPSDEGALDLYRRNPALSHAYPTDQAFLEYVRLYRPVLQIPSEIEPGPDAGRYLAFPKIPMCSATFVRYQFDNRTFVTMEFDNPWIPSVRTKDEEGLQSLRFTYVR